MSPFAVIATSECMYFFPYFGEAKCEKDTVDQCVDYTFWHLLGYSVDEDALVLC